MGLGSPARASRSALALVLAAGVLLAACGSSRYHYVKSTSHRTFMRVPSQWTVYDEDDLLRSSEESPEAKEQFKELTWSVAFDASPKPSLDHILTVSDHPTGLAQVRTLLPAQRDTFSLSDLRSILLRFDPLSQDSQEGGEVEVLESREIQHEGLNGNELLLNIKTPEGELVKWRQVALVDSRLSRVHVLALSCEASCYTANEKEIDAIVDSWKVKKP